MRTSGLLIAGVILTIPLWAAAAQVNSKSAVKTEESTREADKAAASQASVEADQWVGTIKKEEPPPPAKTAEPATPPVAATPPPAAATPPSVLPGMQPAAAAAPTSTPTPEPAAPPKPTYTPRPGLNEMQGKLQSKSSDPRTLRVLVEGGINVEFTYDGKTMMVNGGSPVTIDDLNYGDVVKVRYSGKELYAVELDRISKAP